jgi:hypothetical protein
MCCVRATSGETAHFWTEALNRESNMCLEFRADRYSWRSAACIKGVPLGYIRSVAGPGLEPPRDGGAGANAQCMDNIGRVMPQPDSRPGRPRSSRPSLPVPKSDLRNNTELLFTPIELLQRRSGLHHDPGRRAQGHASAAWRAADVTWRPISRSKDAEGRQRRLMEDCVG